MKKVKQISMALACLLALGGLSGCKSAEKAHEHSLTHHAAVASTCKDQGTIEYWSCSGCNKLFSDEKATNEISNIKAELAAHSLTHVAEKASTCETAGNIEYWTCTVCNKKFSDENGKNEVQNVSLPLAAHKLTHHSAVAPGCEEPGTIEYWDCSVCEKMFSDEKGENEVTSIVDPATGHKNPIHHEAVAGTDCQHKGTIEYWECGSCFEKFLDEEMTEKATSIEGDFGKHLLSHHEAIGGIDCKHTGTIEYWDCSVCGNKFSDSEGKTEIKSIDDGVKGPHNYGTEISEVPAQEGIPGVKAHYECSICKALFVKESGAYVEVSAEDLIIPALVYYDVTFDGTFDSQHILAGEKATKPATDPTKPADKSYTYSFKEWQLDGVAFDFNTPITADLALVSAYDKTPIQYKLTFKIDGEEDAIVNFTCETESIVEPSPTKTGYHAVWGSYNIKNLEDQVVNGTWAPNTDTAYKVEHYQQKADFSGYALKESEDKTGTTATTTAAAAKSYTGFNAKSFSQETIAADGSTVVKIYYERSDFYELGKSISFEDGKVSSLLTIANANSSVDSSVGTDGSKSLKLELTGTMTININRQWMDDMFALAGVDSIAIDAKASAVTGNATNDNLYYKNTGTWTHLLGITNVGNEGLNTNWKTIYITKAMYDKIAATDPVFAVHNNSGKTVWIDNIRPVTKPTNASLIGAEEASIFNNDNKFKLINIGTTSYNAETYVIAEGGNTDLSVEISNTYASEGNNSIHITTSSSKKVNMFINADMYNAATAGFLFDWYTPAGAAITNVKNKYTGTNDVYYTPQNYTAAGKWITFFVPKSAVYSDSLMLFRTDNACTFDFYIDNIRLADSAIDFENGVITKFGRHGYTAKYGSDYLTNDGTLPSKNGCDFFSNASVMEISQDRSVNGYKSAKVTTVANDGLYISDKLYNLIPENGGITIDMYAENAINFNLLNGGGALHDWNPNEWISVTVPKSQMIANANARILFTFAAAGINIYMDNVRIASAV